MSGPDVALIPIIGMGIFAIVVAILFGRPKRKPPAPPPPK